MRGKNTKKVIGGLAALVFVTSFLIGECVVGGYKERLESLTKLERFYDMYNLGDHNSGIDYSKKMRK
jgi:hypothetical protein